MSFSRRSISFLSRAISALRSTLAVVDDAEIKISAHGRPKARQGTARDEFQIGKGGETHDRTLIFDHEVCRSSRNDDGFRRNLFLLIYLQLGSLIPR